MNRRSLTRLAAALILSLLAAAPASAAPAEKDSRWTHWSLFTVVRSLAADGDAIWVGTDHGLMRFNPKTQEKEVYGTENGLLSSVVLFVKVGPDKRVWAGTAGGGLSSFDNGKWTFYTPYGYGSSLNYGATWTSWQQGHGIGDLWVYNVAFDAKGTMWAATWKGLSRFDGNGFHTFTTADGLVDKWIYTLAIDRDGRIWCGTEGGISRYDARQPIRQAGQSGPKSQWVSWTNRDGVGAPIAAVMPQKSNDEGDPYYTGSKHHAAGGPKDISKPVNPNYVSSSLFDREGRLWVGTLGGGLSRFDGKRWVSYTTKDGLSGDVVYALALDEKRNVLWIGTNEGVSRYDFKTFTSFRKDDGLFAGAVYAAAVDLNGDKWFGSYGQVSRYQGE